MVDEVFEDDAEAPPAAGGAKTAAGADAAASYAKAKAKAAQSVRGATVTAGVETPTRDVPGGAAPAAVRKP